MADYIPRYNDDDYRREFGDMYNYRIERNTPQERDEIVDAYRQRKAGKRPGLGEGFARIGNNLNTAGNLIAGGLDRTPIGAAVNWIDRHTGNNLGKLDTAVYNKATGKNLSLQENRQRMANDYNKAANTNPAGALGADILTGFADPVGRAKGILGALKAGAAYGVSGGYANTRDEADSKMRDINYGPDAAAASAATGAAVGAGIHGLISLPISRRGMDWASDIILRGRNRLADNFRKKGTIPERELEAIKKFRQQENKNFDAAAASRRELNETVIEPREELPYEQYVAERKRREADFGFNPDTGKNAFTNTRRNSDTSVVETLEKEKSELSRANTDRIRAKNSNDPATREKAQRDYDEALNAYNRRYDEVTDVRNAYNQAMYEGTPTERQMSAINPARKYSEETGALRGELGERYNPEQVASPEIGQARIVAHNASLPDKVLHDRAMWRGDRDLRLSGIGQEEAENLYTRMARGTEDPITGTFAGRTPQERGRQGEIFERNKAELYRQEETEAKAVETAASRFLRPSVKNDQLKDWSQQQKSDLNQIIRDPDYARKAAEGKADVKNGGLYSDQQKDIARHLTGYAGAGIAGKAANLAGKFNLGTMTGGGLGTLMGGPVGSASGSAIGRRVDDTLQRILSGPERTIPQGERALGRELDRVLPKIRGLPQTGQFHKQNMLERRGPSAASGVFSATQRDSSQNGALPDASQFSLPPMKREEAEKLILNQGKPEQQQNTAGSITNNQQAAEKTILSAPQYRGDWQQQIKKGEKPDFWDGIARIIAGTIGIATGARFDYNVNNRIRSLQEDYGFSPAAASSLGTDKQAYQRFVMQKEDAREKERNTALKAGAAPNLVFKELSDGRLVGLNPTTGEIVQTIGSTKDKTKEIIASNRAKTIANEVPSNAGSVLQGIDNLLDLSKNITIGGGLTDVVGRGVGSVVNRQAYTDWRASKRHLVDMLSLDARSALKGQGQISDYESRLLKSAVTSLNESQSEEQYMRELMRIRNTMEKSYAVERLGYKVAPDGTFLTPEEFLRGETHGIRTIPFTRDGRDYVVTQEGLQEIK